MITAYEVSKNPGAVHRRPGYLALRRNVFPILRPRSKERFALIRIFMRDFDPKDLGESLRRTGRPIKVRAIRLVGVPPQSNRASAEHEVVSRRTSPLRGLKCLKCVEAIVERSRHDIGVRRRILTNPSRDKLRNRSIEFGRGHECIIRAG